ncbi:PREDICTED: U-box domain-containing protein 9-like [Ipomoea nil]|uniref:U-box domain-containing protein 9-like n=1 Tax=Ipomoea nil TaxID=35883 RepID=UPI000901F3DC|nr:PREDICTED: U-box domain-containing protein 9-like [Ipomoea nil]
MAKTGVTEGGDPAPAAPPGAAELKEELQRAVKAVVSEDGVNAEAIDRAQQALCALRGLHPEQNNNSFPAEFRCPLSGELMKDPVVVSSGQTYDRPFIQKWLNSGNRICPQTQQVLSHTILTPNHLIRGMISNWCKVNGIWFPDPPVQCLNEDGVVTDADRHNFLVLLEKMSSSSCVQRSAARELRLLTKRMPSFRALFGESMGAAMPKLLSPFSRVDVHPDLQEDIITTILNLSIHDSNKKLVAETPRVISVLIDSLRSGAIETRSNAAAAIFTLSALDSNKALIGKSGALKPLIDLLEEGHSLAMKDVASAIFVLCVLHENKARAIRDGAVRVLVEKIMNRVHVDELLAILAMLSSNHRAIEEMGELGAVPSLLSLIRDTSCARNKENCIVILYAICSADRTKLKEIKDEESSHGTISQLAQNGTSRAKRKASGVLDRLNRGVGFIHTA